MMKSFALPAAHISPATLPPAVWLALLALALALAVLPLPLAVALIGGSAFALALLLRPILGLYALVLAIPFNP
ncbi:MAG: hypothetical protein J5I90_05455, partial [Caldilineales bacterium]|nr:hypothetical protein [Caldilineales bacterium]